MKAPDNVIRGGLAHELAHIVDMRGWTLGRKLAHSWLYKCSRTYRIAVERNTDLTAVLRGHGKDLLAFMDYAAAQGYDQYYEDGLSPRELRALV